LKSLIIKDAQCHFIDLFAGSAPDAQAICVRAAISQVAAEQHLGDKKTTAHPKMPNVA